MKLKYYMRGLGIGIILTTLIVTISNPKEELTDKEIIKRAEALGMEQNEDRNESLTEALENIKPTIKPSVAPTEPVQEPSETPSGSPEPSGEVKASITPTPTIASISTPKSSPTPTPTSTPTSTPTPTPTPTPTLTPTPTPIIEETPSDKTPDKTENWQGSEKITFTVKRGMSSGQVAALLLEKGIIENAEDFNIYIIKVNKASIIRVGTYTLSKDATYDEIVAKLTTK